MSKENANTSIIQQNINALAVLYKKGQFINALSFGKSLIKKYPDISLIHNIVGMVNNDLCNFDESLKCFIKAIKLKPDFVEAHHNLGGMMNYLGRFGEANKSFNKALEIKPSYAKAHKSKASNLHDLGKFEEAIQSYSRALELKNDFNDAKTELINTLTFCNPKKESNNIFVTTNKLLQNSNFDYDFENKMLDNDLIDFVKKCDAIVKKNIKNFEYNLTQIFRRNKVDLNCERHFKIFNKFKAIPKYCFSCFKVQIEPKSVYELIKLFFIFDKVKLPNNNIKKCMIEMRPDLPGTYKGFVYCSSLEEAKEVYNILLEILNSQIDEKINMTVKRGCSEFGLAYPEYKNIDKPKDQWMKYKEEWKAKEEALDVRLHKRVTSKERVLEYSLAGITLNDVLIIRNWIMYAKKIGDNSYKKIYENDGSISMPHQIEIELSDQLPKRIKEFSYLNSNIN